MNTPDQSRFVSMQALERRSLMSSTISGTVYSELDADGQRESGEAGLAGVKVYLDKNFDGKFDTGDTSTTSASDGSYSFTGLGAGVFRVTVVVPANYRQTAPALDYYDVTAEGAEVHVANDFGLTTTAIIRGTVFNDANHDGVKESTEQGLANVLVFIDKNGNGKFDKGEKSRLTDASGNYRFRGLTAGTYIIRVAPGSGYTATTVGFVRLKMTAGQSLSNRDFGLLT